MSGSHRFTAAYVALLHRFRFLIIVLFIGGAASGGLFMSRYLNAGSSGFDAPTQSRAAVAMHKKDGLFPPSRPGKQTRIPVLVELAAGALDSSSSPSSSACPFLSSNFSLASSVITPVLDNFTESLKELLVKRLGNSSSCGLAVSVSNYAQVSRKAPLFASTEFLSRFDQQHTLLVPVTYTVFSDSEKQQQQQPMPGDDFASFVADTALPVATQNILQDPAALKQIVANSIINSSSSSSLSSCTSADWLLLSASMSTSCTGFSLLSRVMIKSGKSDMMTTDAIVIPLALVVFGITVSSVRLMLLPLVAIGGVLMLSFGLMAGVADHMSISTAAPPLQMSLAISTSVDFSLFIAKRMLEFTQLGHRGNSVVVETLRTAGRTVLLSATVLVCCLAPMCAIPTEIVQSYGIAACLTVVIAALVALVLVPTLMLSFPSFWEQSALPVTQTRAWKALCCRADESAAGADAASSFINSSKSKRPAASGSLQSPWRGPESIVEDQSEDRCGTEHESVTAISGGVGAGGVNTAQSLSTVGYTPSPSGANLSSGALYFDSGPGIGSPLHGAVTSSHGTRQSFYVTTSGGAAAHEALVHNSTFGKLAPLLSSRLACVVVLVVVSALCGVCGWQAMDIRVASDLRDYLPRNSQQMQVFEHFQRSFGFGAIDPIYLLFALKNSSSRSILSNESISAAQSVLNRVAVASGTPLWGVRSVFFFNQHNISAGSIAACATAAAAPAGCGNLDMLLRATVNSARNAMLAQVIFPPVDPVGPGGQQYYDHLLTASASDDHEDNLHDVYVVGGPMMTLEVVTAIYQRVPVIAIVAAAVILFILGIAFRSVVFPLRSLVTLAMTLSVCYGCGVMVYQKGALDWTGWAAVSRSATGGTADGALAWLPPLVVFAISLGVALDCDLFLLIRVQEFVRDAVRTEEAVVLGLCATGSVITSAGIILAVAFFGLVMQEMLVLNEMGFIICVAVLFDTFIVRTLVTPACVVLLGNWHWWPSNPEAEAESHLQPDVFAAHDDDSVADGINGPMMSSSGVASALLHGGGRSPRPSGGLGGGGGGSPIRGAPPRSSPRGEQPARSPRDTVNLSRARLDALQTAQM